MKWIALLSLALALDLHADVGERYQDYVKRNQITSDSGPKDESGLWRIKHTNGRANVLVTVFDGVICEERHYPVNRTEADAVVLKQGNGSLKLLVQGIDEVRWSTVDKKLAARFSAKGKYVQISNPQQVEERLEKYRDVVAKAALKDLKAEKEMLEKGESFLPTIECGSWRNASEHWRKRNRGRVRRRVIEPPVITIA
jgi:hypothetical protein